MDRGLYIAASGMLAEQVRQDQLANDMANTTTPGYKGDRVSQRSFGEMLLASTKTGAAIGPLGGGAMITAQETDLSAAPLKQTGEPLDLAVEGDGFFVVRTPQGERYTRNGSFAASPGGTLVDQLGNPVLGRDGRPVPVTAGGEIDPAGVRIVSLTAAAKAGDGYLTGAPGENPAGEVRTGMLEGSGVDASRTMVDMMASMRAFEAGQRALTTIDSTLELAARQVGNLPS